MKYQVRFLRVTPNLLHSDNWHSPNDCLFTTRAEAMQSILEQQGWDREMGFSYEYDIVEVR